MIDLRPAGPHAIGGLTLKTYIRGTHRMIARRSRMRFR